jgi:hypothetical protein
VRRRQRYQHRFLPQRLYPANMWRRYRGPGRGV